MIATLRNTKFTNSKFINLILIKHQSPPRSTEEGFERIIMKKSRIITPTGSIKLPDNMLFIKYNKKLHLLHKRYHSNSVYAYGITYETSSNKQQIYCVDFNQSSIQSSIFNNITLLRNKSTSTSFTNTSFTNTSFANSDIIKCFFINCVFINCEFVKVNLHQSRFVNCQIVNTTYTNCKMNTSFYNTDFSNTTLTYCTIPLSTTKVFSNCSYENLRSYFCSDQNSHLIHDGHILQHLTLRNKE